MRDLSTILHHSRHTLVLTAHPDDETIGAGALIARTPAAVRVLHVTDGAPHDRRWWGAPQLPTRAAYAHARRQELIAALAIAGVGANRVAALEVVDQEAWLDLAGLARQMGQLLEQLAPDVLLTHAYEGAHPDHDSIAFAAHAAVRLLRQRGTGVPLLVELTSYHLAADGSLTTCAFREANGVDACMLELTPDERLRKARMMDAFASQRATLAPFRTDVEWFRVAPHYDFTAPPCSGPLHYERFDWGCTGSQWRAAASAALGQLGLAPAHTETVC